MYCSRSNLTALTFYMTGSCRLPAEVLPAGRCLPDGLLFRASNARSLQFYSRLLRHLYVCPAAASLVAQLLGTPGNSWELLDQAGPRSSRISQTAPAPSFTNFTSPHSLHHMSFYFGQLFQFICTHSTVFV